MAVIITKQDCDINTANAYYRVESHNLSAFPSSITFPLILSTQRHITTTFANTGNFMGCVLSFYTPLDSTASEDIEVALEQNLGAFTTTIASPAVITKATHGFVGGEEVYLTTTGALPTGLVVGTRYYVKYIDANTFNLSLTSGGANINTSGTQSGVHSIWKDVAIQIVNWRNIHNIPAGISGRDSGVYTVNFNNFSANPAITTSVNAWKIRMYSVGDIYTLYSGLVAQQNIMNAVYCDNVVSFTDNDTVVFAHYTNINTSFSLGGLLGLGDTTTGICGIVCTNTSTNNADNNPFLRCLAPTAPYTLTLKGALVLGGHGGIKVGTELSPVSGANQFTIVSDTPTVGTQRPGFVNYRIPSTNFSVSQRSNFMFYGDSPLVRTTLTLNAAVGTNTITVADSTGFVTGDTLIIGKQDTKGQGSTVEHTVSSVLGNVITLTPNIAGFLRLAGGSVVNTTISKYGIVFANATTTNANNALYGHNSFVIKGARLKHWFFSGGTTIADNNDDEDMAIKKMEIKNVFVFANNNTAGNQTFSGFLRVNRLGRDMDNCASLSGSLYGFAAINGAFDGGNIFNATYKSGPINFTNLYILSNFGGAIGVYKRVVAKFENIYIENVNRGTSISALRLVNCSDGIFNNIYIRGDDTPTYNSSIQFVGQVVNNKFTNISVNESNIALSYFLECTALDNQFLNFNLGQESANAYDYWVQTSVAVRDVFTDSYIAYTPFHTDLTTTATGSYLAFVNRNLNGESGRETTYGNIIKSGDGLADTTVHTAGVGLFSMKLEPIQFGNPMVHTQTIPTGNIENKNADFGVWCKINSADYWANDFVLPRLKIDYDNGTVVYAQAAKLTDRQWLPIPISPDTDYSEVTTTFEINTDAGMTNGAVYYDDYNTFYPPASTIALGGLDLRAKGVPVGPYISTGLQASDIFAFPTSSITTTGSIGALIKKIYTFILSLL